MPHVENISRKAFRGQRSYVVRETVRKVVPGAVRDTFAGRKTQTYSPFQPLSSNKQ